jgi:hypothetical protein
MIIEIYTAAVCPPSTLKSVPVMKLLPRESKKTAGALKSSGAPRRPSNAPAIQVFSTSGSAANRASVIAVRMYWSFSVSWELEKSEKSSEPYAGRQCVDADAVDTDFLGHGSAELVDGGFACVVGTAC